MGRYTNRHFTLLTIRFLRCTNRAVMLNKAKCSRPRLRPKLLASGLTSLELC